MTTKNFVPSKILCRQCLPLLPFVDALIIMPRPLVT